VVLVGLRYTLNIFNHILHDKSSDYGKKSYLLNVLI